MSRPTTLLESLSEASRSTGNDIHYALRRMTSTPAFTLTALITLAVAVGANAAMMTVTNAVLIQPLRYPHSDRIVAIAERHVGGATPSNNVVLTNFTHHAWLQKSTTLSEIGAFAPTVYAVSGESNTERVRGARLSAPTLRILGILPVRGRWFDDEECRTSARVVLVNEVLARRLFGDSFNVLGRRLELDGLPHDIVGVMPATFDFPTPESASIITPYNVEAPQQDGGLSFFRAIGRLTPTATPEQAAAEGTVAARSVQRPSAADVVFGKAGPVEVSVRRLSEKMTERVHSALLVLTAGFGVLLLLACANVGNLFLTRNLGRRHELGLRAALGASRRRLLRQVLLEDAVIAITGALIGAGLGCALTQAFPLVAPTNFPRLHEIAIDWRTLLIASATAVAASVAAGTVPVLRSSRMSLSPAIRDSDERSTVAPSADRPRSILTAMQAALAILLVLAAVMMAKSFINLMSVDLGYEPEDVLIATISLPKSATDARSSALSSELLERVRAMPAVLAAGIGSSAPSTGSPMMQRFPIPGLIGPDGSPVKARALTSRITPGYIAALRMRVVDGRAPGTADRSPDVEPLVVNEAFARAYLADGRPVAGRRFAGMLGFRSVEILGVVSDIRRSALEQEPEPHLYFLSLDDPFRQLNLVVRSERDLSALAADLRPIISSVDRSAVIEAIGPLNARVMNAVAEPRLSMLVVVSTAFLALLLAAVGLYGSIAHRVAERRREIGVRIALGASRGSVLSLMLWHGVRLSVAGTVVGLAAGVFLTRVIARFLHGVDPLDPASFIGATLLVLLTACAASALPARHAASVDPIQALRSE